MVAQIVEFEHHHQILHTITRYVFEHGRMIRCESHSWTSDGREWENVSEEHQLSYWQREATVEEALKATKNYGGKVVSEL